jgi:hypothetical protein
MESVDTGAVRPIKDFVTPLVIVSTVDSGVAGDPGGYNRVVLFT